MTKWFFLLLVLTSIEAIADERLTGKWVDKSSPDTYWYTFSGNSDFEYTKFRTYEDKTYKDVVKGVWETGSWEITSKNSTSKRSCNLTVYAGTDQCCFAYKFVANNLVLTSEYSTEIFVGSMCSSRVLIPKSK